MFTRKHYEFLVEEINVRYKIIKDRNSNGIEFKNFVYQLAESLHRNNENFDREKFLRKAFK